MKTETNPNSSPIMEGTMAGGRLSRLAEEIMKLPPERVNQVEFLVKSMGKRALTLKEAAQMLNISVPTLRRAIKTGSIKAFRINKAGDYRIPMEELDQVITGGKTQ